MRNRVRLQPLFNMNEQEIIGYEALYSRENTSCRFPSAVSILKSIASVDDFEDMHTSDLNYHFADKSFRYFINMTDEDAIDPGFARKFLKTLSKTNLNPDQIVLEVNENTTVNEMERTKQNLGELCSSDVHIALDDFGTNFSTLDFISQLPLDIVKIDKVFVQEAPYSKQAADLLKFSVDISHDIGCSVVAEGIENQEHMNCAISAGADVGQGFIFTPSSFAALRGIDLDRNGVNNPFIPLGDFRRYVSSISAVSSSSSRVLRKSVA